MEDNKHHHHHEDESKHYDEIEYCDCIDCLIKREKVIRAYEGLSINKYYYTKRYGKDVYRNYLQRGHW